MACEPKQILALAKCFQCLDHKQLEMVKSYLLCQIANLPIIAPVLSVQGSDLSWLFSGANPDHWDIETSPDGVTSWSLLATAPGGDRFYTNDSGPFFVRIIGLNSSNVQIVPTSNVAEVI